MTVGAEGNEDLIAAAVGSSLVLVGGHATLAWAEAMGVRHGATTDDVDWFAPSVLAVEAYAARLGLPAYVNGSPISPSLAIVEVPGKVAEDEGRSVDLLRIVHGVRNAELQKFALELDVAGHTVLAMHPVHVLCSKISNLSLPGRGDPNDVAQARVAVCVAETFLRRTALEAPRSARAHAKRIFDLARKPSGRTAWDKHGIDAFDAVQSWPGMDKDFVGQRYPAWRAEISRRNR